MINITKTYKTRDGREVRIYTTDGGGDRPVHGAFWSSDNRWSAHSWCSNGMINAKPNVLDLTEIKPRIKRERWLNIYRDDKVGELWLTKAEANQAAEISRIACVKIVINCEEGEGL